MEPVSALVHYLGQERALIRAQLLRAESNLVEFEVDVDLPQRPFHDVREIEPVRVVLPPDGSAPHVFLLRGDFPQVPHLVLKAEEFPRQICLFERPWSEERPNWAPGPFVERIRWWLAGTADGTLHPDDQPLEPLLLGSPVRLVLPQIDPPTGKRCWSQHFYFLVRRDNDALYFVGQASKPPVTEGFLHFPVIFIQGPTVTHGVIRHAPATLHELEQLLSGLGGSVVAEIANELSTLAPELKKVGLGDQQVMLVTLLPKRRTNGGAVERIEACGFYLGTTVGELLEKRTECELEGGIHVPKTREQIRDVEFLKKVPLTPMAVRHALKPGPAAAMNGYPESSAKVVAIGTGALGAAVIDLLVRSGFGRWTLVDPDYFEPHNAARHVLPGYAVGLRKAAAVAQFLEFVFPDEPGPVPITCDYLEPGGEQAKLEPALKGADLIVDFSASVPVERALSRDDRSTARRMSVFLNQRGDELVILAESADRRIPLLWLEALYLRATYQDDRLAGHFDWDKIPMHRYGNSCRELSAVIPYDVMATHAAIASQQVRAAQTRPESICEVFRLRRDSSEVTRVQIDVTAAQSITAGEWTLHIHRDVSVALGNMRAERLPNETGGILLGVLDRPNRQIAIVDALPAPADSMEWPTCFIRGSRRLRATVDGIGKRTLGNVVYVGEWHSHPSGTAATPSALDIEALALCAVHTDADGIPTLMLIAADAGITAAVRDINADVVHCIPLTNRSGRRKKK